MRKNREDLNRDLANQRQRFSIRKLSIGAASVLIGTALFFVNGGMQQVQADSVDTGTDAHQEQVTGNGAGQNAAKNTDAAKDNQAQAAK